MNPIAPCCKLVKDEDGKAADTTTFKKMVGSLLYLLATRVDMEFSMCLVDRYMERPTKMYVIVVKRIMRYLQDTLDLGILFKHEGKKKS